MESCKCCGQTGIFTEYFPREMMYGDDEVFRYGECGNCGTVQCLDVPAELGRYYRSPYSSWLDDIPGYVDKPRSAISSYLRAERFRFELDGSSPIGRLAEAAFGPAEFPQPLAKDWFVRAGVGPRSRIFDFGCGNARLLRYLRANGFTDLVGFDKFNKDLIDVPGLKTFDDLPEMLFGTFDLVMAHHVLEHLPDPLDGLSTLKRFLRKDGVLLVRVPLAQSYAWRHYGINWVQLDAPRHLVLPSEKGMRALFDRLDLDLFDVRYDSTDFQFTGSEKYSRGIVMFDPSGADRWSATDLFSDSERASFKLRADELNALGDGDQACFYARIRS